MSSRAIYYTGGKTSKRPAFQFYPSVWLSDQALARCSDAEQGVWIRIMCLLHDSEEYGVIRWPLEELCRAAKTGPETIQALLNRGVLRGSNGMDTISSPVYHVKGDGEPVLLLPGQPGPIYFCSRMVRDEYLRWMRARYGGLSENNPNVPKRKDDPMKKTSFDGIQTTIPSISISVSNSKEEKPSVLSSTEESALPQNTGPRSSPQAQAAEAQRILELMESKVPGFREAYDSWRASLPAGKRWTAWASVLKLRRFRDSYFSEMGAQVLEMMQLAGERGWTDVQPEWFRKAKTGGKPVVSDRPGRSATQMRREVK